LSLANLCLANLGSARLLCANLNIAELSGANFIDANLSEADFRGANVENAQFARNVGISAETKHVLIRRGAIFDDSSSDRSEALMPRSRAVQKYSGSQMS
jgi:hypothetical protein